MNETKEPRRIIQIFTRTDYNYYDDGTNRERMFCLCNDGTIWEYKYDNNKNDYTWVRTELDQIQQD